MLIGDEVEIEKSDDPNHGRAGRVARFVNPQAIDVAFEGGLETGRYRPDDLRPVKPVIPPRMQSEVRGEWREMVKGLLFHQGRPLADDTMGLLLTTDDPAVFGQQVMLWAAMNRILTNVLDALAEEIKGVVEA